MRADLVPLLVLIPVLLSAALSDLRALRIPNSHVLTALALFVLSAGAFVTLPEIALRLIAATIVFGIGFGLFALRLFGGGDVKMLAVTTLFIPSDLWLNFAQALSVALLLGSAGIVLLQRPALARRLPWESARQTGRLPMGISIALTPLLLIGAQLW